MPVVMVNLESESCSWTLFDIEVPALGTVLYINGEFFEVFATAQNEFVGFAEVIRWDGIDHDAYFQLNLFE